MFMSHTFIKQKPDEILNIFEKSHLPQNTVQLMEPWSSCLLGLRESTICRHLQSIFALWRPKQRSYKDQLPVSDDNQSNLDGESHCQDLRPVKI